MRKRPMKGPTGPVLASGNGQGHVRLLTHRVLDARTRAAKQYNALVTGISNDLGGDLSIVQQSLVEAFASMVVTLRDSTARMLLGEVMDIGERAQVASAMVRLSNKLGVERVAKDITPDLQSYLASRPTLDAAE
jgi:hypothetical protein